MTSSLMKKLIVSLVFFIVLYASQQILVDDISSQTEPAFFQQQNSIHTAFTQQRSDIQVAGSGQVIKLLPDDLKGSRHQRFIIRLSNGQTVLIAHNIDLAPRIDTLNTGDNVEFNGEYEWNHKGGVVHWTHHDPKQKHPSGWIKHNGQMYQ